MCYRNYYYYDCGHNSVYTSWHDCGDRGKANHQRMTYEESAGRSCAQCLAHEERARERARLRELERERGHRDRYHHRHGRRLFVRLRDRSDCDDRDDDSDYHYEYESHRRYERVVRRSLSPEVGDVYRVRVVVRD